MRRHVDQLVSDARVVEGVSRADVPWQENEEVSPTRNESCVEQTSERVDGTSVSTPRDRPEPVSTEVNVEDFTIQEDREVGETATIVESVVQPPVEDAPVRRSSRVKKRPGWMEEYDC